MDTVAHRFQLFRVYPKLDPPGVPSDYILAVLAFALFLGVEFTGMNPGETVERRTRVDENILRRLTTRVHQLGYHRLGAVTRGKHKQKWNIPVRRTYGLNFAHGGVHPGGVV